MAQVSKARAAGAASDATGQGVRDILLPSFLLPGTQVLAHLLQLVLPLLSTMGFFALSLLSVVRNLLHFT